MWYYFVACKNGSELFGKLSDPNGTLSQCLIKCRCTGPLVCIHGKCCASINHGTNTYTVCCLLQVVSNIHDPDHFHQSSQAGRSFS